MTWMVVAVAVLAVLCVLCFMAWRNAARQRENIRANCAELARTLKQVLVRLDQERQAAKLAAENRKEADAKIDDLHGGDAGGNALDVLSKPPAGSD